MANTVFTRVADRGQEIYAFELDWGRKKEIPEVTVSGNFLDSSIDRFLAMQTGRASEGIASVTLTGGKMCINVLPFSFESPYVLSVGGEEFTKESFKDVKTDWADEFEAKESGDVVYRLYKPRTKEKRPLILFLHGGGEGGDEHGRDNWKQIVCSFGACSIAQRFPDCYVMAPQAKGKTMRREDMDKMKKQKFAELKPETDIGWNRIYLGEICDIIRKMIADGYVDEKRVYVTGLSMGGAGTIRAMSVGAGLFAACAPVCPSMIPETFAILSSMTNEKVWVSSSYIDHTLYRHKYLVDAVMKLKDAGNKNAHLTLYSPEELAKYDIGVIDDMPLEERFGWNHLSWVLTYNNEYGIMDWLVSQTK